MFNTFGRGERISARGKLMASIPAALFVAVLSGSALSGSAALAQSAPEASPASSGAAMPQSSVAPVTVTAPPPGPSTAPSATTPSQKVVPGGISNPTISGATPVPASQGFQVPGENPGYLFNLATFGSGFGHSLADKGVYLHGSTQFNDITTVSGGHKGGTEIFNLGYWGFDLDTEKLIGLPGGLFDMTISTQLGNTAASENGIGSMGNVPIAFGDAARLVNFYYNQSFFDHALQITLGRMSAGYTSTPYLSPGIHQTQWYCSFFTVSCGNTAAFAANSPKAPYEVGSWGGAITIHPAPHWYVKGGVFENQPLEVTEPHSHLGFPGRDWGFNEAAGAFFPVQLGYITSPLDSLYPTNFHIGGYYDSGTFPDKFYNSRLLEAALHPGAPLIDQGTSGIFTALQQTVWRFSNDPRSSRGVSLFFSGDWDVTGLETVKNQYAGGFIVTGPFAQRAADTVNFLISHEVFDGREIEDRDAIAALHRIGYSMRDEDAYEVNYGIAVAPGISAFPYLQYVTNPDQLGQPIPDGKDTHAVTIGLHALFRLDVLFGLPQPH
jgi:porin